MPKFDKYKPSRKVLKPGEAQGHLDDQQAQRVVENAVEQRVTNRGLWWFWGPYERLEYGFTVLKETVSGSASVARLVTSFKRKKPPRR